MESKERDGEPVLRTLDVDGVSASAVVFPYRRRRSAMMVLGSVVFVVFGLGFVLVSVSQLVAIFTSDSDITGVAAIPAVVWNLVLLVLGLVSAGFFGVAGIAWIATTLGRHYVAITADAIVIRDFTNRTTTPWDKITVPRTRRVGLQQHIGIRFRKDAGHLPLPRRARFARRANRLLGYGEADIWLSANSIGAPEQLIRAVRWHKRSPRTDTALTEGYACRWMDVPSR